VLAILLFVLQTAQSPSTQIVSGTVRDGSGAVVAGAEVVVRPRAGVDQRTTTDATGRFALTPATTEPATLVVRALGFAEWSVQLPAARRPEPIDVVLKPATLLETMTVTPARGDERLGSVPASISVIEKSDIRQSPAAVADDVLRRVPTFSLFRRTNSIGAHPTSQGVSLRGIGPSGVSRTLVLLDGVPFNDPFGGWVYWTRLPVEQADRIEVVDGTSSSQYGNYAMGGVINVVSAAPRPRTLDLRMQYGNLDSPKFDVVGSHTWSSFGLVVDGGLYSTEGYAPVVEVNPAGVAERGRVDNNVTVDARRLNARLTYHDGDRWNAAVRVGGFREERNNGKHSTIDGTTEANETDWRTASGTLSFRLPDQSDLKATLAFEGGTFRSNFLAVPAATPPRSIGRMTLNQRVPTSATSGAVEWRRGLGASHLFSTGSDWHWVDADSEEDGLDATTGTQVVLNRVSGGTQRMLSAFVQDIIEVTPDLAITVSARLDSWHNYNGHNLETVPPSGTPTANHNPNLPDRDDTVVSPRIAAMYKMTGRVSIWGSAGAGFRAPTLNELYRQFRVGTTLTLANNQLAPERLVGGELGVSVLPHPNLVWRTTWYDNRIEDPISNVTIATSGANVTQQRQNLGRTRVDGIQTTADLRAGALWKFTGGYVFNRARVTENDKTPALVGKDLPQVPRHRGTVQVTFTHARFVTASVEVLAMSRQFDDDLNTRAVPGISTPGLPAYGVLSMALSRDIGSRINVFFGVQNLFNQEYFVGTLPTTVGAPRMVSGGVRVKVGR